MLSDDFALIESQAAVVGYPLMLKASWGVGGRGMRAITSASELREKILEGRREAVAAFGNGEGYLEKMITRARHVEVQILGDRHGGLYQLYERDCTVPHPRQKKPLPAWTGLCVNFAFAVWPPTLRLSKIC